MGSVVVVGRGVAGATHSSLQVCSGLYPSDLAVHHTGQWLRFLERLSPLGLATVPGFGDAPSLSSRGRPRARGRVAKNAGKHRSTEPRAGQKLHATPAKGAHRRRPLLLLRLASAPRSLARSSPSARVGQRERNTGEGGE
jgi:hypothetical protein